MNCPECDAELEIPGDVISGEIVSCPECGMDYEVKLREKGEVVLEPAEIEGEGGTGSEGEAQRAWRSICGDPDRRTVGAAGRD